MNHDAAIGVLLRRSCEEPGGHDISSSIDEEGARGYREGEVEEGTYLGRMPQGRRLQHLYSTNTLNEGCFLTMEQPHLIRLAAARLPAGVDGNGNIPSCPTDRCQQTPHGTSMLITVKPGDSQLDAGSLLKQETARHR
jgi:hypothetical protein